jgi:hypothetical protein
VSHHEFSSIVIEQGINKVAADCPIQGEPLPRGLIVKQVAASQGSRLEWKKEKRKADEHLIATAHVTLNGARSSIIGSRIWLSKTPQVGPLTAVPQHVRDHVT